MEESKLKQLKVTELKDLLNKVSLPTSGKKDDLIARLVQHYAKSSQPTASNERPASIAEASIPTTTTSVTAASNPPITSQDQQTLKGEEKSDQVEPTSLDDELEKRKKRALKFGTSTDSEEIKKLERAKRFGTAVKDTSNTIDKLDKALSSNSQTSQNIGSISEDPEKRAQRIDRFGTAAEKEELAKKRAREERFGTIESGPTEKKQKV